MSELVRPPSSGQVARPSAREKAGASSAGTTFDQPYTFDWFGLPAAITSVVADGNVEVAACELADDDQSVRRRRDTGEYWQPATIWRATRVGVTLIRLRRTLRMVAPKRFAATGQQQLDHAEFFAARETPGRRRGVVDEQAGATGHGPVTSVDGGFPDTIDYLPAPVKAELKALVPNPTFTHGTFLQYPSVQSGLPHRQTIRLLRLDAPRRRAVVITAFREVDLLPTGCSATRAQRILSQLNWDVTRYSYTLTDPRRLEEQGRTVGRGAPRPELR